MTLYSYVIDKLRITCASKCCQLVESLWKVIMLQHALKLPC